VQKAFATEKASVGRANLSSRFISGQEKFVIGNVGQSEPITILPQKIQSMARIAYQHPLVA
jgi:hypothetical protein